jgi:penicillin-binding protein 2
MTTLRDGSSGPYAKAFLITGFCAVALFGVLILRIFYIQLWQGETYRNLSENNRIRLLEKHAPRGKIMDVNHENLADNRPCFHVTAIPEEIRDYATLEKTLSELSPLSPERLDKKFQELRKATPFRSYTLWKDAAWETMTYLEANRLRIPGVVIQVNPSRDYLFGDLLAHMIGYMGEINARELKKDRRKHYRMGDWVGKVGVESKMEPYLRGTKGGVQVEVDARGRQIRILREQPPIPGANVVLCLDRRLQEVARDAFGDETGTAIAVNPRDGSVLCYVNRPSYDPNLFIRGISQSDWVSLRDDPRHPLDEPGDPGPVPARKRVQDRHGHRRPGRGGRHPGGEDLLQRKPQAGEVELPLLEPARSRMGGHAQGPGGILRRLFLPGRTAPGNPADPGIRETFRPGRPDGDPYRGGKKGARPVSGVEEETVQEAVVRGGDHHGLHRPGRPAPHADPDGHDGIRRGQRRGPVDAEARQAAGISGRQGVHAKRPGTAVHGFHQSPRTHALVKKALRDVVHSAKGTGQRARLPFTEVAGKTGTAQVVRQEEHGVHGEEIPWEERDHAWFACYAPVDESGNRGGGPGGTRGHGGVAAAPIAQKILEAYFHSRGIGVPPPPPDPPEPS